MRKTARTQANIIFYYVIYGVLQLLLISCFLLLPVSVAADVPDSDWVFDVTDYGADGSDNIADTEAIQAAVDAALVYGKGTVYFPPGNYLVERPILFEGNGSKSLTVRGSDDKMGYARLTGTAECTEIFNVKLEYNFHLYNMAFSSQGKHGSNLYIETVNAEIAHCDFSNTANSAPPLVGMTGSNIKISDCTFHNANQNGYALRCYAIDEILNINNYITDNYFAHVGKGVLIDAETATNRPEGLKISRNVFLNTGNEQITVQTVLHCDIANNMIDQCSGSSILVNPKLLGVTGLYIVDNYISPAAGWKSERWSGEAACIRVTDEAGASAAILTITNNMMCYADYGIAATGNSNTYIISGNTFNSILKAGIKMENTASCIIAENLFPLNEKGSVSIDIFSEKGPFILSNNIMDGSYTLQVPPDQLTSEQNYLNGIRCEAPSDGTSEARVQGRTWLIAAAGLLVCTLPGICALYRCRRIKSE